jgi:4-methylaminobutanoate oxidase (formaldehyde-forming)
MINIEPGEKPARTTGREFQIEVAGRLYPAKALIAPPFDPKGERMRG